MFGIRGGVMMNNIYRDYKLIWQQRDRSGELASWFPGMFWLTNFQDFVTCIPMFCGYVTFLFDLLVPNTLVIINYILKSWLPKTSPNPLKNAPPKHALWSCPSDFDLPPGSWSFFVPEGWHNFLRSEAVGGSTVLTLINDIIGTLQIHKHQLLGDLVVQCAHLEKYEFVNGKDDIPFLWNGKIIKSCLKPPTSHQLRFLKKNWENIGDLISWSTCFSGYPPQYPAPKHPKTVWKRSSRSDLFTDLGLTSNHTPTPTTSPHGQGAACQARPSWSLMPALKAPNPT